MEEVADKWREKDVINGDKRDGQQFRDLLRSTRI